MNETSQRGTGRTTGLMLRSVGDALLSPGKAVEFIDHAPMDARRARNLASAIRDTGVTFGLVLDVKVRGNRVYVVSAGAMAR